MASPNGKERNRQNLPVSHNSRLAAISFSSAVLLWFQSTHPIRVVDAFRASPPASRTHRQISASLRLHGISEWRGRFSLNDGDALPLLLLPFAPSQILLPGQSTTFKFRHGKYMDLIDESLTSYESVLGMSILGEDGPLPYAVVCEVLGDELEVNAGYRGFSSMEVGIRAVGRARRAIIANEGEGSTKGHGDPSFRGRTTISDDIHLGRFMEWHDVAMADDEFEIASEYSRSIEGLLKSRARRRSDSQTMNESHELFARAYEATLEHSTTNPHPTTTGYSDSQRKLQAHLMAFSWASLASCDGLASPSIITQALATKDTVERLRLGLAMMLNSQVPREDNNAGEAKNHYSDNLGGDGRENSFQ